MANDRNMINAFDDAIERLATGEDLDQILEDYPDYADHLRDLLLISTRVAEVHNEDDSVVSAQSRGRDRLQQALKEKPKRTPRSRPRWYLTTVAAMFALLFVGVGFLIFALIPMSSYDLGLDMTRTGLVQANTTTEALIRATNVQGTVFADSTQVAMEITPLLINATATPLPTQAPPTVTPPLDQFELTATQLIVDITAMAGNPTVVPPLDQFEMTSTAIIEQVTQDAIATDQSMPGLINTPSPEAFPLTATYFVREATALASGNTGTFEPIPTSVASMPTIVPQTYAVTPISTGDYALTAIANMTVTANAQLSDTGGVEGSIKTTSMPLPSNTPMRTSTATGTPTNTPTQTLEPTLDITFAPGYGSLTPSNTPTFVPTQTLIPGTPVADISGILPTLDPNQPTALPMLIPLSAGEIDDNADWDTYLRYRQEFLARNIPVRDIDVIGRQIITVVDELNRPVLDATVSIFLDGEVVWQTNTYADGRTMFLPNADSVTAVNDIYTVVVTKDDASTQFTLDRRQSGEWRATLPTAIGREGIKLDVLFLIDTTSSMADEIAQLQNNILHISSEVDAFADNIDVRYGLVLYREHDNFEYLTRRHDFITEVSAFQNALNQVTANSGDNNPDWDEALNVGLYESLDQMSWREDDTIKLIFLVADARPHLNHPLEPVTYDQSILEALERGIKIHPIASSGLEQAGEYIFRQIAQVTMGHFIFLTYDDGVVGTPGNDRPEFDVGQPDSDDPIGGYTVDQLSDIVLRLIQDELAAGQLNRP